MIVKSLGEKIVVGMIELEEPQEMNKIHQVD
jgi:hypothetical protein